MNTPKNGDGSGKVVGIRFSKIGKSYFFNAEHLDDIQKSDYVVVQTSRGWQIGEVAEIITDKDLLENKNYKKVDRRATPLDLIKKQEIHQQEEKIAEKVRNLMRTIKTEGIKLITAEMNFDEKGITFLYSSADNNVKNFNSLQNAVRKEFIGVETSFHKIGPRDVAKFYGGMGVCGLETRCCAKFLCNFESISIRMAKTQGVSLSPSDITGICERLRCCLNYEYCQYVDALKGMPKRNKKVITPRGEGKVRDLLPLREIVVVDLPEIGVREFKLNEIEIVTEQKPKPRSAQSKNGQRRRSSRK